MNNFLTQSFFGQIFSFRKPSIIFPTKIGQYTLVNKIRPEGKAVSDLFATYKDETGNLFFAKQSNPDKFNPIDFWFRSEISTHKAISDIYYDNLSEFTYEFPRIKISKFALSYKDKECFLLLSDMVTGKPIETLPTSAQLDVIEEAFSFLNYFKKFINTSNENQFTKRKGLYFIRMAPIIILTAILRHPSQIKQILQTSWKFIINIPFLLRNQNYSIVHRDINSENIIYGDDGKFYIIDFEIAVLSYPIIEMVHLVLNYWEDSESINQLLKTKMFKNIMENNISRRLYSIFTLYNAILNLFMSPKCFSQRNKEYLENKYIQYANSLDIKT